MKKWSKRLLFSVLVLFLAVAEPSIIPYFGMCETVEAASVKISKTSLELAEKESATLKVSGTKKTVKWSSSNKSVAAVKKGKVTAKKAGNAVITAKVNGISVQCKVTVKTKRQRALKEYQSLLALSLSSHSYTGFYIYDVNHDGVPELLLEKSVKKYSKYLGYYYHADYYMYTYYDGKVVEVYLPSTIYRPILYKSGDVFLISAGASGGYENTYFKIVKGKAKEVASQFNSTAEHLNTIGSSTVSKEKCEAYIKKITKNSSKFSVKYYPITKNNIKKYVK